MEAKNIHIKNIWKKFKNKCDNRLQAEIKRKWQNSQKIFFWTHYEVKKINDDLIWLKKEIDQYTKYYAQSNLKCGWIHYINNEHDFVCELLVIR